jgi:hypothetical protein
MSFVLSVLRERLWIGLMSRNYALLIIADRLLFCVILGTLVTKRHVELRCVDSASEQMIIIL